MSFRRRHLHISFHLVQLEQDGCFSSHCKHHEPQLGDQGVLMRKATGYTFTRRFLQFKQPVLDFLCVFLSRAGSAVSIGTGSRDPHDKRHSITHLFLRMKSSHHEALA